MEEDYNIEEQKIYEVLPIKNQVVFPGVLLPIAISKKNSLKLIKSAEKDDRHIILLTQKDGKVQEPKADDLYLIGTLAHVIQLIPVPEMGKDTMMAVFEGLHRIQASNLKEDEKGQIWANALEMNEDMPLKSDKNFKGTVDAIRETILSIFSNYEENTIGLQASIKAMKSNTSLVNYACAIYRMPTEKKQGLLEIHSLVERANALLDILARDAEEQRIKADIHRRTVEKMDKQQREYFLQQELETIKKDLGDTDNSAQTINELKDRAQTKQWSAAVQEVFDKELARLEHMHPHSPDYSTQLDYLGVMLDLPWGIYSEDNFDMQHAQDVLNRDHYGLDKVKERIVEYLAVQRQLALRSKKDKENNPVKSPILCLYGPPGIGKTSLGKSVAESLASMHVYL